MQQIIINSTNIGSKLDGIGTYTLNLLKTFSKLKTDIGFVVLLNKNSLEHTKKIVFPENTVIKWTSSLLSPDYHFKGHLFRFLYSNILSWRYKNYLIFNTGQLEAMPFRSEQIITVHDLIPLMLRAFHKKQYYYFKNILSYALRSTKAVIVPSYHTKDLVTSMYKLPKNKVHVIYHGVNVTYGDKAVYNKRHEKPFVLYLGRISPTKNISNILKAFQLLKTKITHNLIIAGNLAKSTHITIPSDNRVIYKGWVSEDQKIELYKRASLLIYPSLYEGFGLPPLEAMACGCPVIISNVASLPEVCGDAAYYVNPYSVESIAEGIQKVLTDENLRLSLIKKGLERAKLFTWEKSAKEHLKVFADVLKQND